MGHDLSIGGEGGAGRDVVEPSDQGCDPGEPDLRRPVPAVVVGHLALHERQYLASPLVDAEQPRRAVEANLLKVAQEFVDEGGV